ncbi:MAG: hypothetical protein JWO31_3203, partial [Phycisphaerales bacterium]|nr:hypothetical protein [Phycisphaerales bacterium]
MPPQTVDLGSLTTIAGVVAATIALMSVLKPGLAAAPGLSRVPGWVYTVLVAGGLTYVGNRVLGTLAGDLLALTCQVVVNALLSIGTYHVTGVATKPIAASVG